MLSQRLKQLISALGIKKGDFAQRIGFSQAYVSMILGGKRPNPSDRFYESVCREFQTSLQWLRNGEGDMFALPDLNLSKSDATLLKKYKTLPLSEQKVIEEIVDAMLIKNLSEDRDIPEQ